MPRCHGPDPGPPTSSWQQVGREPSLEPEPCSFRNGHTEDGASTSAPFGKGRGTPAPGRKLPGGKWRWGSEDCQNNRSAVFTVPFFFFFLTVLFLLTIFSLKVTTGCKILSFRKLMCGEVTRHFSSNFSDIFLLSVNQYPLVSLGHVINCIAEHILEQTASFKSLSFSLSVSAFSVNICLYVKTPVDPWGAPTVKNLSFVQCLGLC